MKVKHTKNKVSPTPTRAENLQIPTFSGNKAKILELAASRGYTTLSTFLRDFLQEKLERETGKVWKL